MELNNGHALNGAPEMLQKTLEVNLAREQPTMASAWDWGETDAEMWPDGYSSTVWSKKMGHPFIMPHGDLLLAIGCTLLRDSWVLIE